MLQRTPKDQLANLRVTSSQSDPVIALIDDFWGAFHTWKVAYRRHQRYRKKLGEDITRAGRVAMSPYHDPQPFYSSTRRYGYSDTCVEHYIAALLKANTANLTTENTNCLRTHIAHVTKKWKEKETAWKAELKADQERQLAKQKECGFFDVVANERKASDRLYKLRYDIFRSRPMTIAGAAALSKFISDYERRVANHKHIGFSPTGYYAVAAKHVADVLSAKSAAQEREAA